MTAATAEIDAVIPVAQGDSSARLIASLRENGFRGDIIAAGQGARPAGAEASIRYIPCEDGRAAALNAGARAGAGRLLWFIHADAALYPETIARAAQCRDENAVYYFSLRFYDGGALMRLTEAGVALRCALFALPYGDQGLLLSRALFTRLGGYNRACAFGEDARLICRVKRENIRICRAGGRLGTSARKYKQNGFFRTTYRHAVMLRQLLQEERGER